MLAMQSYSPFGVPRASLAVAQWGFTGEWHDPGGLVYLRARWYNAAWGRFTQVDPFPGALGSPASRHPYAYALNSPLMHTDPSGRVAPWVLALVFTGVYLGGWYGAGFSFEALSQVNAYAEATGISFLEAYAEFALHPRWALETMDLGACQRAGWSAAQAGAFVFVLAYSLGGAAGMQIAMWTDNPTLWRWSSAIEAVTTGQWSPWRTRPAPVKVEDGIQPSTDPTKSPAPGWQWKGTGTPTSGKGAWVNATTGESLHPHFEPSSHGPHWDYIDPSGVKFRWFLDGRLELKGKR